ncbi:MAG: hypothetical protein HC769_19060 [Cyanobacteria bacterium CRU_2_1]|nr:hypothetical protein [Cyanobacteria bacterium RU_5_0]NJR60738.1 hypothetical protein [Cyanobacteria bacterium CRU_2_1]
MTRSALPENWHDLMAGYALGNLSPEEAEQFQRLLTENPDLTEEVDRLQEVLALMPYSLSEQEPPPHLRDSILNTAQASTQPPKLFEEHLSELPLRVEPKRRRNLSWRGLGGAVAAAALLALAVQNNVLRQQAAQNEAIISALEQPGTSVHSLQGTEQAPDAFGSVIVTRNQQVAIVAQNLPELPSDRVYRLWAMPAESSIPSYCGQFNTTPSGTISIQWIAANASCNSGAVQLLITSEFATDPFVPKGELVMRSQG